MTTDERDGGELACCPFCGDVLRVSPWTRSGNGQKAYRLLCISDVECFFMDFDTEAEAIEMMNRRSSSSAVVELVAVIRAYEQWEADMIMDDECWPGEFPTFTAKHGGCLLAIAEMRNAALAKHSPKKDPTDG